MLSSISINNYALIDTLELDMNPGLSIITGETGAGKSILLGALGLLLGKRADTSVLKDNTQKCIVEGIFSIKDYGLQDFFTKNELDYHNETCIRREIAVSGKSRAFINDTPVTLNTLQELTLSLVDIHSQHQNLSLNNADYIRWIVDAYAGTEADARILRKEFFSFTSLKEQYESARKAYEEDQNNLDYLTYQFQELNEARLQDGELTQLEEHADTLGHATEIKSAMETAGAILDDEERGVVLTIKQILNELDRIRHHLPAVETLYQRIQESYIELRDVSSDLVQESDRVEVDPQKLEEVTERINLLNTLLHKHKSANLEELITLRDTMDARLQQFAVGDYELDQLKGKRDAKEQELLTIARNLSKKRKAHFSKMEAQIQELLRNLGMKNGVFQVKHEEVSLSAFGIDQIQFFFSANSNIAPQSIAKVASGGELSRLMLAVKYLISGASGLPTIIFDEIDTGVSGEIADKVGNLIKEMAQGMQVLNITHLPQIAGKGNYHFSVYKEHVNGSTQTRIRQLNTQERLSEIARMLSGDKITDAAMQNAKVLLES